jgi:hypothetical protein
MCRSYRVLAIGLAFSIGVLSLGDITALAGEQGSNLAQTSVFEVCATSPHRKAADLRIAGRRYHLPTLRAAEFLGSETLRYSATPPRHPLIQNSSNKRLSNTELVHI